MSPDAFYQKFLATLAADSPYRSRPWKAEGWGNTPAMADELGGLIAAGTKTATCSALWSWEAEGETPPVGGELTVVVDGRGDPLCIVETFEVTRRRYCDVDADFARQEGEGDLSLDYWRRVHRQFFTETLADIGRGFTEALPLVCERFRKVF